MGRAINWPATIRRLRRQGHTLYSLAEACDTAASTISKLAEGHTEQPRYELGARLLELLEEEKANA